MRDLPIAEMSIQIGATRRNCPGDRGDCRCSVEVSISPPARAAQARAVAQHVSERSPRAIRCNFNGWDFWMLLSRRARWAAWAILKITR